MSKTKAYCANEPNARVVPTNIDRRPVGPNDVQIGIEYCGVCHTDIHFVNNDWGMTNYPVVPGHEIVGRVTEVGSAVKNFKLAIVRLLVASLIPVESAETAKKASSNIASMDLPPPTILKLQTQAVLLMVDIPPVWLRKNLLSCTFLIP